MNKVKWGLIGCGDIATRCVGPAIDAIDNCELTAVSRHNRSNLGTCADRLGAKKRSGDWRALVTDDEIDAVYIATPVFLHC